MPKETYLTMCISKPLKAELQKLALEQGRDLTNFIDRELRELLPPSGRNRKTSFPKRQLRGSHLTMWINAELKAKLRMLADNDYRNLTDLVEVELQRIVAAHRAALINPPLVARPKPRKQVILDQEASRDRIAICINPQLKGELQKLAYQEYRSLTNFIEFMLHRAVSARHKQCTSLLAQRQPRDGRLTIRISSEFKAQLKNLADQDYRTLTDYTEIKLRQIVAIRRGKR